MNKLYSILYVNNKFNEKSSCLKTLYLIKENVVISIAQSWK